MRWPLLDRIEREESFGIRVLPQKLLESLVSTLLEQFVLLHLSRSEAVDPAHCALAGDLAHRVVLLLFGLLLKLDEASGSESQLLVLNVEHSDLEVYSDELASRKVAIHVVPMYHRAEVGRQVKQVPFDQG